MSRAADLAKLRDAAEERSEALGDLETELDTLVDSIKALRGKGLSLEGRAALAAAVTAFRVARKRVRAEHAAAEREHDRLYSEAQEAEFDEEEAAPW